MSHLPLQIGIGTNYIADFVEGISFHNQEDLLDFILDKTEVACLLFDGTTTIEESRSRAREMHSLRLSVVSSMLGFIHQTICSQLQ